jgi:hypothetical protein
LEPKPHSVQQKHSDSYHKRHFCVGAGVEKVLITVFWNGDSTSHTAFLRTLWSQKTATKNSNTSWINMFCFCYNNYEHNCTFNDNTTDSILETSHLDFVWGTGYTDLGLLLLD